MDARQMTILDQVTDPALGLHAELNIVAVCPSHEAHPLDLVDRKGGDCLLFVADQLGK